MSRADLPLSLRVHTWAELHEQAVVRRRRVLARRVRWGRWRFRPGNLTLEHADGYYVDLERMKSSAGALDWIAQVAGKAGRFTAEDVGHLVRALDELLKLQANVCSFQRDHTFDFKAMRKKELAALKRGDWL